MQPETELLKHVRNTQDMGIKDYFRAPRVPPVNVPNSSASAPVPVLPAVSIPAVLGAGSVSPNSPASGGSSQTSGLADDLKHEVMVNYLYQQQCSHMWAGTVQEFRRSVFPNGSQRPSRTGSAEWGSTTSFPMPQEGVLLRKSRGNYIACPPELIGSPLEAACIALNVPVSLLCSSVTVASLLSFQEAY